ncbi:MAG: thioredoxin [Clostridia bacterium]|nr:thioredoxin [Clostridia bacterium]
MVVEINSKNFEEEVLKSKETVILDFYGTWCMPCKMIAPIVEKIAEEKGIKLAKVDVDQNEELIKKFRIMSIPTLKIFKEGKEISSLVGLVSEAKILEQIQ